MAATSADFDRALEPPPPVGVAAAADLGRADRCEEEENDAATAIVAISGHFGERDSFPPPLRIHASSSSFTLSSFTISDPLRFKHCPRPTSISLSILAAVFLSYVADSEKKKMLDCWCVNLAKSCFRQSYVFFSLSNKLSVTIREKCTEIVSQSQAVYVENSERKYNYKKALYVR